MVIVEKMNLSAIVANGVITGFCIDVCRPAPSILMQNIENIKRVFFGCCTFACAVTVFIADRLARLVCRNRRHAYAHMAVIPAHGIENSGYRLRFMAGTYKTVANDHIIASAAVNGVPTFSAQ